MRFSTPHTVFQNLNSGKMVKISLARYYSGNKMSLFLKMEQEERLELNPPSMVPTVQESVLKVVSSDAENSTC